MSRLNPKNPDLPLSDLMGNWPEVIPVFLRHRMLCVGCLINPFHTVEDACAEYGLDRPSFEAEIERAIANADQD